MAHGRVVFRATAGSRSGSWRSIEVMAEIHLRHFDAKKQGFQGDVCIPGGNLLK